MEFSNLLMSIRDIFAQINTYVTLSALSTITINHYIYLSFPFGIEFDTENYKWELRGSAIFSKDFSFIVRNSQIRYQGVLGT